MTLSAIWVVPQEYGGSDMSGFSWEVENDNLLWVGTEGRYIRGPRCSL